MHKNDIITLDISGYTHDGLGVGKADGVAVFVPGAAAGDRCEVRIEKELSNRCIGKLTKLITPSPDRCDDACAAFPACGGCSYRHISYEAECRLKADEVLAALKRIAKAEPTEFSFVPSPEQNGCRNKAVFPVGRGADGQAVYGFYRSGSHRIVPCGSCLIHPPEFDAAAKLIVGHMNKYGIAPYDEAAGIGSVRAIFARKGAVSGELMVCIVTRKPKLAQAEELALCMRASLPNLQSLQLSVNPAPGNRLLGDEFVTLCGETRISDVLAGNKLSLSAKTFYQVNHSAAELMYAEILRLAEPDGKNALDLYCGAGSITLALARRCRAAIGIEVVPEAVRDAVANANANEISNARFFCADAAGTAGILSDAAFVPDVVVADPPRKGLEPELCRFLLDSGVPRIVLVSCDPATLARDVGILSERYSLGAVTAFDMFPRTANVETVALLTGNQ